MSATSPTICGRGRSRISTNGETEPRSSMTCRSKRTCQPATSGRGASRPPPGCSSRLKTSSPLATFVLNVKCVASVVLAVFGIRRASCCTGLPTNSSLNFGGNALGKDHAHSLPLVFQPRAQPALTPPLATQKGKLRWKTAWWWWRWWVVGGGADKMYDDFISESQRMHQIGVAERLGVRLPASPPPGTQIQLDGVRKMPQKKMQKPSSPPPRRPNKAHPTQLALCVPVSVLQRECPQTAR